MKDFNGVKEMVDIEDMRKDMVEMGGDKKRINKMRNRKPLPGTGYSFKISTPCSPIIFETIGAITLSTRVITNSRII